MTNELEKVIQYLAGVCDYAEQADGQGFNKPDSFFGHRLARTPFEFWTAEEYERAYTMVRKYQRQYSIKYVDIPKPEFTQEDRNRKLISRGEYEAKRLKEKQEEYNLRTYGVEYRRNVKLEKGKYIIAFDYDPKLVEAVKKIPGVRFNWDKKTWEVKANTNNLEQFTEFINVNEMDITPEVQDEIDRQVKEIADREINLLKSRIAISDFNVEGLGGELRPFQKAGVEYASKIKRCFIADEMGLGKTVQGLATLQATNSFPALIVCPASLKLNWKREAEKWLPGKKIIILNGKPTTLMEADVIIINYDIIKKWNEKLKAIKFQAIIFDESHYLKNYKAQRTETAKKLAGKIPIRLLLTGTPVLNRPQELLSQLGILGRVDDLGGFWEFAKRYCGAYKSNWGWDLSGASNLEELNQKMRAICFIRRNKADVLKELPPKQRSVIEIEIDNRDEYTLAQEELINFLQDRALRDAEFNASIANYSPEAKKEARARRAQEVEEKTKQAEQLVKIETLKQVAVKGKIEAVSEWVANFLETGEKLILFGHHTDVVNGLAEAFNAPAITGSTPIEKRQEYVDKFQNDPNCKLIVLNMRAGGVGLTLTASSNVAFVELGWTPADHDQAEDRAHRIGQKDSVNCYYFIGTDTIDEDIYELIQEKREVVNSATDGEGGTEYGSVMRDLVKKLLGRN